MQCFTFLYEHSKQDTATNNAHSKHFIELLKDKKILTSPLSIIWENTDGSQLSGSQLCSSDLMGHGKTLMVVLNNIYVPFHYILFKLCCSVTQLYLIGL